MSSPCPKCGHVNNQCVQCGHVRRRGAIQKLNDKKVRSLRNKGLSLAELAEKFEVTRGGIQASLRRSSKNAV